ncbi:MULTISPECIES: glycosyltransferase family 2 protein [unclassified Thioalkalivibrio]|uniref:glycosyltransferase family 2 protein n=1 Tax=unclassified Thioalkalivibrio TaxID=2621013 RepID=UPI00037D4BFA|nr:MULTISPECIES: glycosyltransferase family 2 protein [unclassified Thioalkalivibrio]
MTGAPAVTATDVTCQCEGKQPTRPAYSVIVPVYDHWSLVPELLDCLRAQTLPQDEFEVILINNGLKAFTAPKTLPRNVRILQCDRRGSYAARNAGVSAAAGDWLVFTDADCRPVPEWLEAMRDASRKEPGNVLLAGPVEMYADTLRPNAYQIYDLIRGIPQEHYVRRGYAATANLLIPRPVLEELGGFDATRFSGGDADLCRRAVARGYPIRFVPEALVYHPARESWEEVVAKARRIKGGQILCGSSTSRTYWVLRTLLPPVALYYRYALASQYPVRYRLVSLAVQSRLWGHELMETLRLLMRLSRRQRS